MTEPIGSVSEEAARLFAAVREQFGDTGEGLAAAFAAGHGEECRACPLCAGLRLVRGARPEVYTHLLEAADAVVAALRAAVEPDAHRHAKHPGVEHINVR